MNIYIAASWKHQHAVEMLTELLRAEAHTIFSFVENNHGEQQGHLATADGKPTNFDEWCMSERGEKSFKYDTDGAMLADLVIYIGPSGKDAAAECGMAYGRGVPIIGLYSKGEDFGLMRRMIDWYFNYRDLLYRVSELQKELRRAAA